MLASSHFKYNGNYTTATCGIQRFANRNHITHSLTCTRTHTQHYAVKRLGDIMTMHSYDFKPYTVPVEIQLHYSITSIKYFV